MTALEIHPSAEELASFTLGRLDEGALAAIETHLATCTDCQERAAAVPGDSLVELLRSAHTSLGAATSQAPTEPQLTVATNTVSIVPTATATEADGTVELSAPPLELAHHERYRIVRLLGAGGMGSVYEAEHRVMQRPVALKVINPAFTSCSATLERFRREVRAAARLAHPNIVTTYDAEDAGKTLFLVMEFVEGASLGKLVKEQGSLPIAAACAYVRQAALGLQHAHERGMVHRDVKPDNLILVKDTAPAVVKVLDFGLAVLTAERADSGLTNTNVVMGTPDYMAPEQAEDARSADIRADVYSLGCTLYYLLTGGVPYPAATMMQKILAHREKPIPSLSKARPDLPPGLVAVVTRMLAKQPAQRYQTPGEVAAALEPFTAYKNPPPAKRGRKRGWLVGAAMLCFGLILAAGVAVYRIQTDEGEIVITAESPDVEVRVTQGGKEIDIIDTKTSRKLRLRSGVYDLELKDGKGLKLNITKAELMRNGRVLATIERLPKLASKSVVEPKTPITEPRPPLTSPQPIFREIQLLQRVPIAGRWDFYSSTAVSNDGKTFVADVRVGQDANVVVWDGETGKERYRVPGWMCRLTPDGQSLFVHSRDPQLATYVICDAATGKRRGSFTFNAPLDQCKMLPDSRHAMLFTRGGITHLCDLVGTKILHSWPGWFYPRFTDDGRILLVYPDPAKKYLAWDVEKNQPSTELAQLTKYDAIDGILPGNHQALVKKPGEEKLRYFDIADGTWGPSVPRMVTAHTADGRALLDPRIQMFVNDQGRLWTLDHRTGQETAAFQLPAGEKFGRGDPVNLSPNGRFACVETDQAIYLLRLAETPEPPPAVSQVQLLHRRPFPQRGGYCSAAVAPDGKFFSASWSGASIIVWEGSSGKELYRLPEAWHCFTPDGARLVAAAFDRVRIHDAASGKNLHEIFLGEFPSRGVYVLPDNRHLVALTAQGKLHLGDMQTGKIRHTWPSEETPSWTPDGTVLFVKVKGEKNYLAWDVPNNKPSADFPAPLATLPETKPEPTFSLRNTEGKLQLWDNRQSKERAAFPMPDGEKIVSVGDPMALSTDSRYACVMTSSSVYLLRLPEVSAVATPHTPHAEPRTGPQPLEVAQRLPWPGRRDVKTSFSDDSRWCVAWTRDAMRVYETETGRMVQEFVGIPPRTITVGLLPDGKHLISTHNDGMMRRWDIATGKMLRQLQTGTGWPQIQGFTPAGDRLCLLGEPVQVWDLKTGKMRFKVEPLRKGSLAASAPVSPDGKRLLTVDWNGDESDLRIFEVATGQPLLAKRVPFAAGIQRWGADNRHIYLNATYDKQIVIACVDGDTGKIISTVPLAPQPGASYGRTFSRDGRYFAVQYPEAGLVHLYDTHTGQLVFTANGPNPEFSLSFAPNGRYAACGGQGEILIYRLPDPTPVKKEPTQAVEVFRQHWDGYVNSSVDLSPDGRLLVAGYWGVTRVWDVATGKPIRELPGWIGRFTPDGKQIVTVDECVNVYDTESGKLLRQGTPNARGFWDVYVYSDGRRAITPCPDHVNRLWDLETGKLLHSWPLGKNPPPAAADVDLTYSLTRRGPRKLEVRKAGKIFAVDSASGADVARMSAGNFQPSNLSISRDGRFVAACAANLESDVVVWRLPEPAAEVKKEPEKVGEVRTFKGHSSVVRRVFFANEGRHALSAGFDRILILWDVATGKEVRRFEGHTNWIDSAAVSRDSRLAISGGLDNTVRVWEVATGKELRQFKGNPGRVVSLAISNDGKWALTGSWDRTMRLFDMETGNELRRFNGHVNVVQAVAFSPDGLHALSGSWEKGPTRTLKMFEVDTGRDLGLLFDGYAEGIQDATVSPDGTLVLSGGPDKAVRLWDAATGKALRSFEGHKDMIKSVAFAPDGRRALSGGDDRTVRLWDVATGEPLHCFFGHTALVTSVAFSPDGRYALSGSDDQTMRLWRLPEPAPTNKTLNP